MSASGKKLTELSPQDAEKFYTNVLKYSRHPDYQLFFQPFIEKYFDLYLKSHSQLPLTPDEITRLKSGKNHFCTQCEKLKEASLVSEGINNTLIDAIINAIKNDEKITFKNSDEDADLDIENSHDFYLEMMQKKSEAIHKTSQAQSSNADLIPTKILTGNDSQLLKAIELMHEADALISSATTMPDLNKILTDPGQFFSFITHQELALQKLLKIDKKYRNNLLLESYERLLRVSLDNFLVVSKRITYLMDNTAWQTSNWPDFNNMIVRLDALLTEQEGDELTTSLLSTTIKALKTHSDELLETAVSNELPIMPEMLRKAKYDEDNYYIVAGIEYEDIFRFVKSIDEVYEHLVKINIEPERIASLLHPFANKLFEFIKAFSDFATEEYDREINDKLIYAIDKSSSFCQADSPQHRYCKQIRDLIKGSLQIHLVKDGSSWVAASTSSSLSAAAGAAAPAAHQHSSINFSSLNSSSSSASSSGLFLKNATAQRKNIRELAEDFDQWMKHNAHPDRSPNQHLLTFIAENNSNNNVVNYADFSDLTDMLNKSPYDYSIQPLPDEAAYQSAMEENKQKNELDKKQLSK